MKSKVIIWTGRADMLMVCGQSSRRFIVNQTLLKKQIYCASLLAFLLPFRAWAVKPGLAPRPPQYVMMAFDGSLDIDFWEKSRAFAKQMKSQGKPLNFTYFMSGVYFLNDSAKNLYTAPEHGPGKSAVGFGGSLSQIPLRVSEVNKAYQEGNEIGSHANCHFDGGKWTLSDWTTEFNQFWHLIFDVFSLNKIPSRAKAYIFDKSKIVGFRAPYLSTDKEMYTALKTFGFKYDTSRDEAPDYWPARNAVGLWNFPLADLLIYGTGKKTLSMDYNFYVAQSGGVDDPKNRSVYIQQMENTYLKWFQDNYNGNRAPLNIGHHFWAYQGGGYWEAEKMFASKICGLPEVRCVTYSTYMKWIETLDSDTLSRFRQGQFPKASPISVFDKNQPPPRTKPIAVSTVQRPDGSLMVEVDTSNERFVTRLTVNGLELEKNEISYQELRSIVPQGARAQLVAHVFDEQSEIELARATQELRDVGTEKEILDSDILENRASLGDLPEAHSRGY
jgi:hypothetical protein